MAQVAGEVEAANDRGLKVNGQWYNYGRYRGPRADVGEEVTLEVTDRNFINRVSGSQGASPEGGSERARPSEDEELRGEAFGHPEGITGNQLEYLTRLAEDRGIPVEEFDRSVAVLAKGRTTAELTKLEASSLINFLFGGRTRRRKYRGNGSRA